MATQIVLADAAIDGHISQTEMKTDAPLSASKKISINGMPLVNQGPDTDGDNAR